ncbi:MAG: hypothetical protein RLZZ127_1347, partial [Planctomycetota bacterium]
MPRPALRLVPTLLAVASAGPALVAADIYVSAGAAAGGTGTFAAPYRTIAAGLAVAQAGDTVWLRAGEYRETIDFPRSGAPGAPITLAAYAPGGDPARRERVVVHRATIWTPGSGGFGTWQDLGGGRWSILLPSSVVSGAKAGQFIVTLGTQVLQDARWPNTDV